MGRAWKPAAMPGADPAAILFPAGKPPPPFRFFPLDLRVPHVMNTA